LYYIKKAYRREEVKLYAFVTSALNGRSGQFHAPASALWVMFNYADYDIK
jgi:hypothetical protein